MTLRLRLPVVWVPDSVGGIVSSAASDASTVVGSRLSRVRAQALARVRPPAPPRHPRVVLARRVVGGLFALSALAMGAAAATADSDKNIRSDGSKGPMPHTSGDPKGGKPSPEAENSDTREPANPDA